MPREWYKCQPEDLRDARTGRAYQRLTNWDEGCVHLYFTENSYRAGGREIFFQSERDTKGASNLFLLDPDKGEARRLTALGGGGVNRVTKTPDGELVCYCHGRTYYMLDVITGETIKIMDAPEGFWPARVSISCDKKKVAMQLNEDVKFGMGLEYKNFSRRMYAIKRSEIWLCDIGGGRAGTPRLLMRDTAEGGHLQFSPTDPELMMFCHEGPWNLVAQRVYLLRTDGALTPCFRQGEEDSVGHEFFTRDGGVYLDDRGPNHDGSILSTLKETCGGGGAGDARGENHGEKDGFKPFLAYCSPDGAMRAKYLLPHYFQHCHCGKNRMTLCADGERALYRVTLRDGENGADGGAEIEELLTHGTSWRGQHTHPHPTVSFDDKYCLFASDKSGVVQLYQTAWGD